MSRISLVEAYDNRDVIGQLVRLREDVNELQNILKDIDPDGDLTNVVTKTGDQVIDGIKTFVGKIVADCDIIQLGGNYETHAEQVYSKNDYIVMRDEAVSGLAPGTYSGFQVKKYNGSDDARLVVDNEGVARVGDLNDEQPLLTRDEVADMTSGNILSWDGVNKKAITSGKSVSDLNTDIAAKVSGTGNIGTDTKPVKIVNGEAIAVSDNLMVDSNVTIENITSTFTDLGLSVSNVTRLTWGPFVQLCFGALSVTSGLSVTVSSVLPAGYTLAGTHRVSMVNVNSGVYIGEMYSSGTNSLKIEQRGNTGSFYNEILLVCNRS